MGAGGISGPAEPARSPVRAPCRPTRSRSSRPRRLRSPTKTAKAPLLTLALHLRQVVFCHPHEVIRRRLYELLHLEAPA
eukprot:4469788-Pyramimonas_sp.AAC.1